MILSILALPFIQFGINWWISVGSLGSIVILYAFVRYGKIQIFKLDAGTTAILFMMSLVYIWQDLGNSHSFLRISREALLLMLVVVLNKSYKPLKSTITMQNIEKALLAVMLIEFTIAVCQFFFLPKGIWIGPSADWFGGRGNSIPSLLDLQYSELRPSGTFSEPSYLGIFCVSILIMVSRNFNYSIMNRTTYFVSLVTIVLSQSKSALLFALLMLQNGGFLDFDKLFLVTVVFYIYRIRSINSDPGIKTLN